MPNYNDVADRLENERLPANLSDRQLAARLLRAHAEGEKSFEEWWNEPAKDGDRCDYKSAFIAGRASLAAEIASLKTRSAGDHDIIFNEHDLACCKRCHGGEVELVESCAERLAAAHDALTARCAALERQVTTMREALEDIAEPLKALRAKAVQEGGSIDGVMASRLCADANWLRDKACRALAREGGEGE